MWMLISTTLFICTLVAEGQNEGDLRLAGRNNPKEGRLEIYYNSTWGTICDDEFGSPDANVACRQLGYRTSTSTSYTAGGGSDPIWLDSMGCDGSESRIDKCDHRGWKRHKCSHGEDVGVRCTGEYTLNGNWGTWSSWTTCSASCDSGFKTRNRLCNNPVRFSSISYCHGKSFEVLKCSTARCRVDGNWGTWSIWSVCNATCGGGVKIRTRNCNNPYSSAGRSTCSGMTEETLICAESNCPVNGGWSEWNGWSFCSTLCGTGNRTRTRLCDNPSPSYGGRICNGTSSDLDSCNTHECPVDGDWSGWSSWNICSATCDGGIQDRTRKCDAPQPINGGLYCNGTKIESRPCNNINCEIDGNWGTWSLWSVCNATCGGGSQKRTRKCNNPYPSAGGSTCSGMAEETLLCAESSCPVNGGWSEWDAWSMCSSSCGSGKRTRTRLCDNPPPSYGGSFCNGITSDLDSCNTHECPVDGSWSGWSSWNICSATCNGGIQDRTRKCDSPQPINGGLYCNGTMIESRPCNNINCEIDGNWGTWSMWSVCNATCGDGVQIRTRNCNNPYPSADGSACSGMAEETLLCAESKCPVNGGWSEWDAWSTCSSSCGSGKRTRTRLCDNPPPSDGGRFCNGITSDLDSCNKHECPVDGSWSGWSSWNTCSATCNGGIQDRTRICNAPQPINGGLYCNGTMIESRPCNNNNCKIDGNWGTWSMWSVCNATCGGGVQIRTRNCNNPYPYNGGSTCSGMAAETLLCAESNCPFDGDWSEWNVWSLCSTSCGSGNRRRTRLCNYPPPSYGGSFCNENSSDMDTCNTHECPVDGNWSGWSSWNICSATCDGGIQDRTRKCDAPEPINGGLYCNGTMIESRPCNNINCEIDGQWGTWQEWEACNTTCGNGTQQRLRKCDSPSPYFNGSECMGLDFDNQICYQDKCPDAQLQANEDTPNFISPVILGSVAVVFFVITGAITCISFFVFRRFRPGKVATRNINGSNTESLAELRVTTQENDYDCVRRVSRIQSNVYDTFNNESNVYANTQITVATIETGAHANILCNADNAATGAHANVPCNVDNTATGAHANSPCNADNIATGAHANIPCNAGNIATGAHANIPCNADNITTGAHANIPCNAGNIATGAHANIPCTGDNVDEVYENLEMF